MPLTLTEMAAGDSTLRKAMADAFLDQMHRESLLIHMPIDGTPESQACTEHVVPGIYTREQLERLAEFNRRKQASTERTVPS